MRRFLLLLVAATLLLPLGAMAQKEEVLGPQSEKVLVRAPKASYGSLKAQIEAMGGKVTHEFRAVDAVAAEMPAAAVQAIKNLMGQTAVSKDELIPMPAPVERDFAGRGPIGTTNVEADSFAGLTEADIVSMAGANPNLITINNQLMNVAPLLANGIAGQGIIVGVIDSGIRPNFPHITLDGSVIACEDFVGDSLGCSNSGNNGHGTFVAGMISGNVVFTFSTASTLRNSVLTHCPSCFANPPTNTQIPMLGSAPLSSIYALRVFGASGGAPTSRILAAMDRALQLKQDFDNGVPGGVNIQVVNMSLGGATFHAGRDLFDQAVDNMLQNDIVMVISAGNAGPSSLTTGSPGSAIGAVTVGAASHAHNERILRDVQFGLGVGSLYRPFGGTQMATFSSRGPNADGRIDPDIVANGFACIGQGLGSTTTTISLSSGTSFSSPSVAGVAALLRQAFPMATAKEIRVAILASANAALLADGSINVDQGRGFVDALAAATRLANGQVEDVLEQPPAFTNNAGTNARNRTTLDVRNGGNVVKSFSNLLPGQREELLYEVRPNVAQVVISLANVAPELPPAQQNQFFGDDVFLTVHSAKTSAIGQGHYLLTAFTTGGVFVLNNPETGFLRVTVNGDWTNAGRISGDLNVFSVETSLAGLTGDGKIGQSQQFVFPVNIPAGTSSAEFKLFWRHNWGAYPINDLDMILVDPNSNLNFGGATINSPESVTLANPTAGLWFVVVDGFSVLTPPDSFLLRVAADGVVLKP
jgi:subtilisin family serine protease